MTDRTTILLVDDHVLVRRGFRRLIEDEADLTVVGEVGNGREAIEMATRLKPDVIVLDYALPEMNGVLAAREILAVCPETKILMLSMHAEESYVRASLEAGAHGYLLKSALDLDLVEAIRNVAAGNQVLDPNLPDLSHTRGRRQGLTPRELEVLRHIVAGKSNKEIAGILNLSANTVSVHRANIMDHLGVHNAAELVAHAIRNGLVSLP